MRDANALELLTFQTFLNLHLKLTGKMHLQQKQKKIRKTFGDETFEKKKIKSELKLTKKPFEPIIFEI